MQKLYLDCDGVILDTINKSYRMLEEKGITDASEINSFFCDICWSDFIIEAGELNGSIAKIRSLIESELFDIKILTHVNSEDEINAKVNYFRNVLPEVEVIPVFKSINKGDAVDPTGAILVDDYLPNLDYWSKKNGISVKFSDSGKTCRYTVITDLLDLLSINFDKIM